MRTETPTLSERQPADEFERRYGRFGGTERRTIADSEAERSDGAPEDATKWHIIGHAAVFDQWSLDLGFFREKIARGAFDEVLASNPDVFHLWDHDTRYVLGRTASKTTQLSLDSRGLRFYTQPPDTPTANELRVSMLRGDINQSSFAFTVAPGGDEWVIRDNEAGNEVIERTITRVGGLYDVTTTAMGAYPQTDSQVARGKVVDAMRSAGQDVPGWLTPEEELAQVERAQAPDLVAQGDPAGEIGVEVAQDDPAGSETLVAQDDPAGGTDKLSALRAQSRAEVQQAREDYLRLLRRITA